MSGHNATIEYDQGDNLEELKQWALGATDRSPNLAIASSPSTGPFLTSQVSVDSSSSPSRLETTLEMAPSEEGWQEVQEVARVEAAAARSGLVIFRRLDVIGKTGKSPLFASFAMRLAINDESVVAAGGANDAAGARAKTHVESLTVRGSDLKHTAEYEALMQRMGIPPVRKK